MPDYATQDGMTTISGVDLMDKVYLVTQQVRLTSDVFQPETIAVFDNFNTALNFADTHFEALEGYAVSGWEHGVWDTSGQRYATNRVRDLYIQVWECPLNELMPYMTKTVPTA